MDVSGALSNLGQFCACVAAVGKLNMCDGVWFQS
jgi:hypothetical protein